MEERPDRPQKRRRKNVSRACDFCKGKKIRCDGTLPCSRCRDHGAECTYYTPYSRGSAVPVTTTASLADGIHSPHVVEPENERILDSVAAGVEGFLGESSNLDYSRAAQIELRSQPTSPLALATRANPSTTAGHSGTSVTSHQRQQTHKRSRLYFTEPPFPPLNLARYSLPSTEQGLILLDWYFENASPTYRLLHRPTMEKMVCKLCVSSEWLGRSTGNVEDIHMGKAEEALVLMSWALACQLPLAPAGKPFTAGEKQWLRQKGEDYYQAALMLLEQEKSVIDRLNILQTRFLMCQYLLTTARLKLAWDLFAIVKNMANNLDLNKPLPSFQDVQGRGVNGSSQRQNNNNRLRSELRLRTFWAIYTLDSYLATMLGKSFAFEERDIRVGYPSLCDDQQLEAPDSPGLPDVFTIDIEDRPSLMLGPIAHAKLARIIRRTLILLYRDQKEAVQLQNAATLLEELELWHQELPTFLRDQPSGSLQVVYARQSNVIQLARFHAIILICRPFLSIQNGVASTPGESTTSMEVETYKTRCLEAAFHVHETVAPLIRRGSIEGQFWFTSYIVFCAATVLLVYLGHHPATPRREHILNAAETCCEIEKKLEASSRLARRYVLALEALSSQVRKRSPVGDAELLQNPANNAPLPSAQAGSRDGNQSTPEDLSWQPSLESLIETYGNNFFPDFDSTVTGGTEFSWLP
ncbi:hypothetical protein VTO42DRAFT_4263 [Malbranchea cinnamomea]